MTKKIKKGKKGTTSKFITRSKAIKKLDIPLKDFRKLCILKGVHPRIPKRKTGKNHTTYYHQKDISYLSNDKTLMYFRNLKIFRRKLHRAIVRRDKTKITKLKKEKPQLDVNHIIKQRYPDFQEALKDLEDPLSLLSLLSKFPGHRLFKINPQNMLIIKMLLNMFKAFVVRTQCLEKVFLSVKGIYFQVRVNGQLITWLEPYPFAHQLPFDVDYKVIISFSEFYQTLLKFVVFKLYKQYNIVYPPTIVQVQDEDCCQESTNKSFLNIQTEKNLNEEEEENIMESNELNKIKENQKNSNKNLFKNLRFFLSREVNKELFEFCIKAFNGEVFYDLQNFESEVYLQNNFTHVIVDRQIDVKSQKLNTNYVQPQWICDSINNNVLLPVSDYQYGKNLPAHLSPFVDFKKEGYFPDRYKEIMSYKGEYVEESVDLSDEEDKQVDEKKDKKEYNVTEEKYDHKKEQIKKKEKQFKKKKEEKKLSSLMLSRKKKRLYEKLKNCDKEKRERIKELIRKRKMLKQKEQKQQKFQFKFYFTIKYLCLYC